MLAMLILKHFACGKIRLESDNICIVLSVHDSKAIDKLSIVSELSAKLRKIGCRVCS